MFIENYTGYRKYFAATYISDSGDITKKKKKNNIILRFLNFLPRKPV